MERYDNQARALDICQTDKISNLLPLLFYAVKTIPVIVQYDRRKVAREKLGSSNNSPPFAGRTKTKKAMSKDMVSLLVDLIQSHPIIITKETNAATNKLKQESLTNKFNSKSGQIPRQIGQLKLKWGNLKKATRMRAAAVRMNNLKTGKPGYIPPDEIIEKVTSVLGSTCSGFEVPFGGDGVGVTENVTFELDNADGWTQVQEQLDTNDASVNIQDESLLPISTTKKFKTNQEDGKLQRNLAVARYYDKKQQKN
ncbi:unnamed protein product [Spodoptera littoralis]|uniref:Regulatory protein zeste n=1 Tax=Spodoptera littoralis TaxID=7109 RepID=A0A9P0MZL8_SPOLI|nr:unnamed protein product [Spodoptera littoralis]CAH1636185.1 unnamed protein product [Spodoptera littoralis]